jgi:hypothetical protein
MTDRNYENYDRNQQEEAELEEWRQWAESWLHEVDEEYGAGEEGTNELSDRYRRDTPGQ